MRGAGRGKEKGFTQINADKVADIADEKNVLGSGVRAAGKEKEKWFTRIYADKVADSADEKNIIGPGVRGAGSVVRNNAGFTMRNDFARRCQKKMKITKRLL